MSSKQKLSLRWNNYLKHVTSIFDNLRSQNDLVDVTLCCEGKKIRAHKMLLSACSTYFREIFRENPCQHPVIIFRNVKYEDLSAIVHFMYHGEVNVTQEELASFLITAELLEVQGLTDDGEDKVQENIAELEMLEDGSLIANTNLDLSPQTKKRKFSVKKSVSDSKYWDESSEINVISLKQTGADNLKIETMETIEDGNKAIAMDGIPSTSAVAFPETTEVSDTQEYPDENSVHPKANINLVLQDNQELGGVEETALKNNSQDADLVKFRCHVCWKGFKHPTSLTLHKDSHTGKTQCPVCRRSFSRSYDMRSHLMKIHQDQSAPENS